VYIVVSMSPNSQCRGSRHHRGYNEGVLVAEWMTRELATLGPDDTLGAAIELMSRRKVRRIPVVEHGQLLGIVAKSDVLNACPPDYNPFSNTLESTEVAETLTQPLRGIMSVKPLTVRPDAPVESAAQLMIDHKIGGLPVVADHLVGILTESDLFRALAVALGTGSGPGLRITFDVSMGEDAVLFVLELARKRGLRLASISTHVRDDQRYAIVRLAGTEPAGLVDELWRTGHRVVSVLRLS
jgi:acetoin utilization protein AcuB